MPRTSLKPYDALFAASQRARKPVGAAAGAARNGMPWYDPLVPIAHGLKAPVLGGLGLGAVGAATAPEEDRVEAGIASGLIGAGLWSPVGIEQGLHAKRVRDFVRKGVESNATFGGLHEYAQRAQEHVTDPTVQAAFKRHAAKGGDPFHIPTMRFTGATDEERVHSTFRRGMKEVPKTDDALMAELRKEFPGLSDRQIAGKLHPDQRGATEAPTEDLDAAYQNFIAQGRGKARNAASTTPEGIAREFHAEGRNKALDFLHSWRGDAPDELKRKWQF